MPTKTRVSKNLTSIGAVSAATIVSRLLGLVRDMFTAAVFGASALNSAYITAFTLPNLFRRLLGEGSLTAALVPTLTEELDLGGRPAAFVLLNKVLSWLLVVTVGLVLAAVGALHWLHDLEGLSPRWYIGAQLGQLLFPYLIVICTAAAFGAVLNLLEEFAVPAFSPIWLNLAILASLGAGVLWFAETPMERMYWLCGGTLLGGCLQMFVPGVVLWRKGWRPGFDFTPTARFREILRLMGPGLFGTAIFQINILISRGLAFWLNESAATLLYLANRLMEVPLGVFTISVSTVTFPTIARFAARCDYRQMADAYHRAILLTMNIALPASVGLLLLAEPIVRLLFERGAFERGDTVAMIPVLAIFCGGLPFYSYVILVTRAFYSLKDTATPVRIAAGAFVLNLALSLLLMRWFGTVGLAAASNLSIVMQTFALQFLLGRRVPELRAGGHLRGLVGVGAMAAIMGVVVWAAWWLVRQMMPESPSASLVAVMLVIPIGALAYLGPALLFRIPGLEEVRSMLGRFLRRGRDSRTP